MAEFGQPGHDKYCLDLPHEKQPGPGMLEN
jgi:hypothetical protein